jgi:ankyrin repeat protein
VIGSSEQGTICLLTASSFGQAETQSQLSENHDAILVRLARLDRAIKRANDRLHTLSAEPPHGLQVVDLGGAVKSKVTEFDDTESRSGVETLKECISMAETVRDTFESAYDPDGKSLMRFSDDSGSEASDDELYDQDELGDIKAGGVRKSNDIHIGPDELIGHPNPAHDESTPLEVLSLLIDDLKEHAQKDLEAGNPKRAEVNLIEAIQHAEEREHRYGIKFRERVEVQENLAFVYQKQKKWAEARKILHGLLQEDGGSEAEPAGEKEVQHSRQYHLLATIHFEMYQAHPSHDNPQEAADLRFAETFAKLAVNKKYKLRGTMSDRQDSSLLDSVQTLIKILEAQGRTALAESYHRQFMASCTPISPPLEGPLRTPSVGTGSDIHVIDIDELLISAIKAGDHNDIESLVNTADVNCRCSKGRTPLMHGVEQGDEVTIRKLLHHGAEINATTASGATALHQAATKGNVRMARLLLELDADMEAKDKNLATPLVKAVEKNHGLLVSYLLGQGADIHVKDKAGWTLLHHAAHNGAVDVLKHLLYPSHEVDVNATCPAGKTALHYCAELTLIEPAKILLSHQSDINALDANSRSPLFFAVNKPLNENRERFVTLLLDNRAQVDLVRLPARHRDYPALQNHPSIIGNPVLSPPRRRESASSMATSGTSQTGRAFLRRFSLKQ